MSTEETILLIIALSAMGYIARTVNKYRKQRAHYLNSLQTGQHIKAVRKNGRTGTRTIVHTWIQKVDPEIKCVHTPIGRIDYTNILN